MSSLEVDLRVPGNRDEFPFSLPSRLYRVISPSCYCAVREESVLQFRRENLSSHVKKLISKAAHESTKKVKKKLLSTRVMKIYERVIKQLKPLLGFLVCQLIMSLADRLSIDFTIFRKASFLG